MKLTATQIKALRALDANTDTTGHRATTINALRTRGLIVVAQDGEHTVERNLGNVRFGHARYDRTFRLPRFVATLTDAGRAVLAGVA